MFLFKFRKVVFGYWLESIGYCFLFFRMKQSPNSSNYGFITEHFPSILRFCFLVTNFHRFFVIAWKIWNAEKFMLVYGLQFSIILNLNRTCLKFLVKHVRTRIMFSNEKTSFLHIFFSSFLEGQCSFQRNL